MRYAPILIGAAAALGVGVGTGLYLSSGAGGDGESDAGRPKTAEVREDTAEPGGDQQIPWVDSGEGGDPYSVAKTPGAVEVYRKLKECYPDEESSNQDIYEQTPCFQKYVAEVAKEADPADFFAGVKAVVVERPDVFAVCHDSGHKGSDTILRRFWNPEDPIEDQHRQLKKVFSVVNDTCMSGFIHGLFDTLGYLKAEPDSFNTALEACVEASARAATQFDCADGFGHAAWEATGDLGKATGLCTMFPENDKRVICDGGIIMRMYQHLEKKDPWYLGSITVTGFDTEEWMETVASICSNWPGQVERDKGSAEGCWAGTPYLFFKPLYSNLVTNDNDFQASKAELQDWIVLMGKACDSYGKVGSDVCYEHWDQYLSTASLYDEENLVELCTKLEKERRDRCVEVGVKRLREDKQRKQATRQ